MSTLVIGEIQYPHVRISEWDTPSDEVAQRWADEVNARYAHMRAKVMSKWSGTTDVTVVQIAETIDRPIPTTEA